MEMMAKVLPLYNNAFKLEVKNYGDTSVARGAV